MALISLPVDMSKLDAFVWHDLKATMELNPEWDELVWDFDDEAGEYIVRLHRLSDKTEINGHGETLDAAVELMLVRCEMRGDTFNMPDLSADSSNEF